MDAKLSATQQKPYIGPVLFIVHGPPATDRTETMKEIQNRNKIRQALIAAASKGIPVFYYAEMVGNGLLTIHEMIGGMKTKPRALEIYQKDTFDFNPEIIKTTMAAHQVTPTSAIFMGQLRELCVRDAAIATRAAFPKIPLSIIEGKGSVFMGQEIKRNKYKDALKKHSIQRTKKLKVSTWRKK